MKLSKTITILVLAPTLPLLLSAVPAHAASSPGPHNEYLIDAPQYITGPTPITVTVNPVDGGKPVCGMQYEGISLTAAPWMFTLQPVEWIPGHIDISLCDGGEDYASFNSTTAYGEKPFIIQEGSENHIKVTNDTLSEATVTVTLSDGSPLATGTVKPKGSVTIDVPLSVTRIAATETVNVNVTNADGVAMNFPVLAAHGWSVFSPGSPRSAAVYSPCQVIPWFYDDRGHPKGATKTSMTRDIKSALARISRETGLRFVRRSDGRTARLVFNWAPMGSEKGIGAVGSTDGVVTFNSEDIWSLNAHSGFGGGRPPGRGWLIIHEVMHTMGFDHVRDAPEMMNPVNYGMHRFGSGDLEGLHYVYPRTACTR